MKAEDRSLSIRIALVLVLLAGLLRFYGIRWGLPDVYEEATPINVAWDMWGWGEGGSFDANPHFFNYPSLIIYLQLLGQGILYLGMRLFGAIDSTLEYRVLFVIHKTPFFFVGRTITAIFGTATILVTYLLGLRIAGRRLAMPAAFLVAINAFHITKSQVVEVDVPLAFFVVLTLLFAVRLLDEPTRKNHLLAGLALGLAVSTKYTAALLVFPVVAAHVLARWRPEQKQSSEKVTKEKKPPKVQLKRDRLLLLCLALVLAALVFFATSPFVFIDASTFSRHLAIERQHMRLGHFGMDASGTWLYYARAFTDRLLGWPLALVALAGMVYLAGVRRRAWAITLAAFVILYMLAVSSWVMKADRYVLAIVPVAVIFAFGIFDEALQSRFMIRLSKVWRAAITVAFVLLLSVPLLARYPDLWRRLRPDTRTKAREWIVSNIPSGCFLVMEAYTPQLMGAPEVALLDSDIREKVLERMSGIPNYAIQPIPMFQVQPERAEIYYDPSLYDDADVIVTSSSVRSRYEREPERFRAQLLFYRKLEKDFRKVIEFVPQDGAGPTLRLYRNPLHTVPFAGRKRLSGPRDLGDTQQKAIGSAEYFYSNLGLNYEAFRFYKEALACYTIAFKYPVVRPKNFIKLVLGKTRCLMRLEGREAAVSFLQRVSADAPTTYEREKILRLSNQLQSGIRSTK